jgi:hypothetical protein
MIDGETSHLALLGEVAILAHPAGPRDDGGTKWFGNDAHAASTISGKSSRSRCNATWASSFSSVRF